MHCTWVRAFSILLPTLLTAACSEATTGPESGLQGSYALTRVDAESLPVALWRENGQTLWLLSETLGFDGRGTATRVFTWRRDSLDVIGVETQTVVHRSSYRVRADSVIIGRVTPCPPDALCTLSDLGLFSRDSVLLARPLYAGRSFLYERGFELRMVRLGARAA